MPSHARLPLEVPGRKATSDCGGACEHLLEKGELLGDVLRAVLIFAEGDPLFALQASVGEVVARHGQHGGNGEGLLLRQGGRRLHGPWESPLKPPAGEDDDDDDATRNIGRHE